MSSEPFLPGQRKTSFLSKKSRVFALWLLLICMFLGIYQLFSSPPAPGMHGHHAHAHTQDPFFDNLFGVMMFVVFIIFGAIVFVNQRNVRRAVVMNGEGLGLLARGELQKAQALFETMGRQFRRLKTVRGLAQFNLAWVYLVEGELARATAELTALEQRDGLATMPALRSTSAANLALCHALAGDFELATPWLDEAEKQRPTAAEPLKLTGSLTLVRAIIDCRQGRPTEATRALDHDWQTLEGLGGDQLRPLRLLRAFALAAASGPREDGAVDRLLAPLRESRPGSLRYLTVAWPELATFMDLHHV